MTKEKSYIVGIHSVKAVLKNRPQDVLRLFIQETRQDSRIKELKTLAKTAGVLVELLSSNDLQICLGKPMRHQGVAAECKTQTSWNETDLLTYIQTAKQPILLLIMDGVQDPHNLGACLRSANAFGVTAVIIPKDRAVQLTDIVRKVSSGAVENTPLFSVTNLHRTLKELQNVGVWLVGMDDQATVSLNTINLTGSIAIVMGGEGQGIRRLTREVCDYLVQIPMQGAVESLNVSVAAGIALYEVQRQRL